MQLRTVLLVLIAACSSPSMESSAQAETHAAAAARPMRKVKPADDVIRKELTALQYSVTQQSDTEMPFKNVYWDNHKAGIYVDIVTGEPLFSSQHKFESGTGWPSFYQTLVPASVVEKRDGTHGMMRVEVRSKIGDSHLGHLFDDGPKPTGLRYCINSASLRFIAADQLESLAAAAVRVRFRPNAAPGGVRVTIGTDEENATLLAIFGITAPASSRRADVIRDTKETRIALSIDLDRPGPRHIDSGIPFYDHMLDQVAAHGGFALTLACTGDVDIDPHHSIEDIAIALGTALRQALGDKRGIGRFGFVLPMDETEAQVLIDLSGRPFAQFDGSFDSPAVGDLPTQMVPHIFRSLADSLGAAIHVRVTGDNDHHKVEACFKAFGRALRQGLSIEGTGGVLPSTKGML